MSYQPVEEGVNLEVLDDDGELDAVQIKAPQKKQFNLWIILIVLFFTSSYLFFIQYQKIYAIQPQDQLPNQKKRQPKIEYSIDDQNIEEVEIQSTPITNETELTQVNKTESESEISDRLEPYSDPDTEASLEESSSDLSDEQEEESQKAQEHIDKELSNRICPQAMYMDVQTQQCQKCEDNCLKCQHFSKSCFQCDVNYYINEYGKCVLTCETQSKFNILSKDETQNMTQFCFADQRPNIFISAQTSNLTDFELPFLIIHPAETVQQLYHQKFPLVYFFNNDLFNYGHQMNIQTLIDESIENQIIIVVLASASLYDFPLYHHFLFQPLQDRLFEIVKIREPLFIAYCGLQENAYGAIRQYQSQFKTNNVDLILAENPIQFEHNILDAYHLVTSEQHISDGQFTSLVGTMNQKTKIVIFHNEEYSFKDICQRFKGYQKITCFTNDGNSTIKSRIQNYFQLISQFVQSQIFEL